MSGRRLRGSRPEWPGVGVGLLGPHQLASLGERCKLHQQGPGRSSGRQAVLPYLSLLKYRTQEAPPDTSILLLLLKTQECS